MKNRSNIWIATLTLTAILLVVILLSSGERQAQASMINVQANFSLITAGPPGTDDALIIVDGRRPRKWWCSSLTAEITSTWCRANYLGR